MRIPIISRNIQYITVFTATLSYFSCGMLSGWPAPMLPRLMSADSVLPLTGAEASWVVSSATIAMPLPVLIVPLLVDVVGRKTLLVASAVPLFVSWLMVLLANSAWLLIVSRIVAGFSMGTIICVGPMYVGEVAETRVRGALGTVFQFMLCTGMLLEFCLVPYLSYSAVAILSAAVPVLFLVAFAWMPESPYFLAMRGREKDAEHALRRLRGAASEEAIQEELSVINKCVWKQRDALDQSCLRLLAQLFQHRGSRRALLVCVGLILAQCLTGMWTLLGYTTEVFQRSGVSLDPDICTIVVALVQVVTSVAVSLLIDNVGRRPLLLLSCAGCALTIAAEGIFFYLKDVQGADMSSVQWLPLTAFIAFLVLNILGLIPVPWALVGEVFPSEVKGPATAVVTVVLSVSNTVMAKLFQVVSDSAGMHVVFFSYSACATLGLIFTFFCVPETKGRSFLEILRDLEGSTHELDNVHENPQTEVRHRTGSTYEMKQDIGDVTEKPHPVEPQDAVLHL